MLKRKTRVSSMVTSILTSANHPLSVNDILNKLSNDGHTPNKTTIYRIIEKYLQSGRIYRIQLNHGTQYFEMQKKDLHHHFFCNYCKKIFCLSTAVLNAQQIRSMLPSPDFTIESQNVTLYGACDACKDSLK